MLHCRAASVIAPVTMVSAFPDKMHREYDAAMALTLPHRISLTPEAARLRGLLIPAEDGSPTVGPKS